MQHIKRFAGDHVASKRLLQDGPGTKSRGGGHFKTAYSAEHLCWTCGSASHDARDCKMLNTALADYQSKYLHRVAPAVMEDLATTTRAAAPLVVGGLLHASTRVEGITATTTRVEDTTATTTRVAGTLASTKTGGVPSRIASLIART